MSDDVFSLLGSAIRRREELSCSMAGIPITLRPYVLYESLSGGSFWVGGLRMPDKIAVYIPLAQLQEIVPTGHTFDPEPLFDLDDPRYDNAVAIIESLLISRRRHTASDQRVLEPDTALR
jgi:hypothetical protein